MEHHPALGRVVVDQVAGVADAVVAFWIKGLRGLVGRVAVARKDADAPYAHFQLVAIGHELEFEAGQHAADDAGAIELPVGAGDGWRGFGGAPRGGEPDVLATHPARQRLQAIPGGLGQRGSGVEHDAQAGQHAFGQLEIGLEKGQGHLEAFGDVEPDGWLYLGQVGQGLVDQAGGRATFVDHQGATVAQDHVDVVVAAKRVAPGQPVHQHGLFVVEETPGLGDALLVGAQHAMGVDHHLWGAGGARGEQVLGVGLGREALERRHDGRGFVGLQQGIEREGVRLLGTRRAIHHHGRLATAGNGRAIDGRIAGVDQAGVQGVEDAVDLGVIGGESAVGTGDGAGRDADMHGRQREQQVFEGVVGHHHDRSAMGQVEVEETLADATHLVAGLPPCQLVPGAGGVALGKGQGIWGVTCPLLEPLANAAGVRLQGLGRTQQETAAVERSTYGTGRGHPAFIVEPGNAHGVSIRTCMFGWDALYCVSREQGIGIFPNSVQGCTETTVRGWYVVSRHPELSAYVCNPVRSWALAPP